MGVVYGAKQNGADQFIKRVAIKLIREEYLKTDEFRANSIGEARLVASQLTPTLFRPTISEKSVVGIS